MDPSTIQYLLQINKQFYQTFAVQFAATRRRLQRGVLRILERLPRQANVLDLGCGNGELWRVMAKLGHTGKYVGLDSSSALINIACKDKPGGDLQSHFMVADLTSPAWPEKLNFLEPDYILALAVLHHLPGLKTRKRVIEKIRNQLAPGGYMIHSEWQFLNSPRLVKRIQSWEIIGLDQSLVDPGDYLLDWREGGSGLRYVHLFNEVELAHLAEETGFKICETFYSDGETDNLSIYQTWLRV